MKITTATHLIKAVLVTGIALSGVHAWAGPGTGPYGPFNSGGAYGGLGPYSFDPWVNTGPLVVRGERTYDFQTEVATVGPNAPYIPYRSSTTGKNATHRTYQSESVERVGERINSKNDPNNPYR